MVRAVDQKNCNSLFCKSETATCELDARIPVVELNGNDEGGYPNTNGSADGQKIAHCELDFGGFKHTVSMSFYATKNEANGTIKVVGDIHVGKNQATGDVSMSSSSRSVTVIPASAPSFVVKGNLQSSAYAAKNKNALANTSSSVDTEINFSSLTIEAP